MFGEEFFMLQFKQCASSSPEQVSASIQAVSPPKKIIRGCEVRIDQPLPFLLVPSSKKNPNNASQWHACNYPTKGSHN